MPFPLAAVDLSHDFLSRRRASLAFNFSLRHGESLCHQQSCLQIFNKASAEALMFRRSVGSAQSFVEDFMRGETRRKLARRGYKWVECASRAKRLGIIIFVLCYRPRFPRSDFLASWCSKRARNELKSSRERKLCKSKAISSNDANKIPFISFEPVSEFASLPQYLEFVSACSHVSLLQQLSCFASLKGKRALCKETERHSFFVLPLYTCRCQGLAEDIIREATVTLFTKTLKDFPLRDNRKLKQKLEALK